MTSQTEQVRTGLNVMGLTNEMNMPSKKVRQLLCCDGKTFYRDMPVNCTSKKPCCLVNNDVFRFYRPIEKEISPRNV